MKKINLSILLLSSMVLLFATCRHKSIEQPLPIKAEATTVDHLMLTERAIRLANISWMEANASAVSEYLTLPGRVINDPGKRNPITSRIAGRVERLYLQQPGMKIHSGDVVAEIFNPEWTAAVSEFIRLRQEPAAETLFLSAKNRLRNFGFTETQMETWSQSTEAPRTFVIRAENNGNLAEIEIRQGSFVEAGQPMAWTADTFASIVEVRIDPGNGPDLKPGMKVEVSGDTWKSKGVVKQVDPVNEEGQNFRNARVELSTGQSGISPGAPVRVHLKGPERKAIMIPASGLVFSNGKAGVFTTSGDGGFQLIPVETGLQQNGLVEILKGLNGGEKVVQSGTYLLFSELVIKNNGSDRLLAVLSAGSGID